MKEFFLIKNGSKRFWNYQNMIKYDSKTIFYVNNEIVFISEDLNPEIINFSPYISPGVTVKINSIKLNELLNNKNISSTKKI